MPWVCTNSIVFLSCIAHLGPPVGLSFKSAHNYWIYYSISVTLYWSFSVLVDLISQPTCSTHIWDIIYADITNIGTEVLLLPLIGSLLLLLCLCLRSFITYVTTCKIDNVASALCIHKWRVDACIHGSTLLFLWARAYSTDLQLTSCVYLHVSNLLAQLWLSSVKDMNWRALISLDVKDAAQKIKEKTRGGVVSEWEEWKRCLWKRIGE